MESKSSILTLAGTTISNQKLWEVCRAGIERLGSDPQVRIRRLFPTGGPADGIFFLHSRRLGSLSEAAQFGPISSLGIETSRQGNLSTSELLSKLEIAGNAWKGDSVFGSIEQIKSPMIPHRHRFQFGSDFLGIEFFDSIFISEQFAILSRFLDQVGYSNLVKLSLVNESIEFGGDDNHLRYSRNDKNEGGIDFLCVEQIGSWSDNLKRLEPLFQKNAAEFTFGATCYNSIDAYQETRSTLNDIFTGWTSEINAVHSPALADWWKTGQGHPKGTLPLLYFWRKINKNEIHPFSISVCIEADSSVLYIGCERRSADSQEWCTTQFDNVRFQVETD